MYEGVLINAFRHIRWSWCLVSAGFACALCCAFVSVAAPPAHAFPDYGTQADCYNCGGTGWVLGVIDDCGICNGTGLWADGTSPCPSCRGTGAYMYLPVDCPYCDGSGHVDVTESPATMHDIMEATDVLGMVISDSFDLLLDQLGQATGSIVSIDNQQFDKIAKFSTGGVFALVVVVALLAVVCGLLFASILVRLWRSR